MTFISKDKMLYVLPEDRGAWVEIPRCINTWLENSSYHRITGPAITWSDGLMFWMTNGRTIRRKESGGAINEVY